LPNRQTHYDLGSRRGDRLLRAPETEEAALSEDLAPVAENSAARAEILGLQDQLKTIAAERDRAQFEKNEIVSKANAIARERDDFRSRLEAATAERDRLAARLSEAEKRAQDASLAAASASAEAAEFRRIVESTPKTDPAQLLWLLIREKTTAAVAWVRAKIPAESPVLPWFDKTIEVVTQLVCMAIAAASAFLRWVIPEAIKLTQRLLREAEALLAKK
jgi:hypothetical protein